MKNLLILFFFLVLFTSFDTNDKITSRSNSQIFITGNDLNIIKKELTTNYKLGYRVTGQISQSNIQIKMSNTDLQKSEILIIMEK